MTAILTLARPDLKLVLAMKINAAQWIFDGRDTPSSRRRIMASRRYHPATQAVLIFTRDTGHHSSGWWKNPDYERCFHLSVSFVAPSGVRLPYDWKMARAWVEAFFGENAKLTWHEGPYTAEGKADAVHHYRLFADEGWAPIKPRGEVYNTDWTPGEWKSFSDVHGEVQAHG